MLLAAQWSLQLGTCREKKRQIGLVDEPHCQVLQSEVTDSERNLRKFNEIEPHVCLHCHLVHERQFVTNFAHWSYWFCGRSLTYASAFPFNL